MCRRGRSGSARHRTSRRTRAHGDAPLGHRVRVIGAAGRDADGVLLSRVMSSASEHVSDVSGAGCGSRGRRDMSSASSTLTTSPQWTLARRAAGPSHRRSGAARRCYDEVRSGGRRLGARQRGEQRTDPGPGFAGCRECVDAARGEHRLAAEPVEWRSSALGGGAVATSSPTTDTASLIADMSATPDLWRQAE